MNPEQLDALLIDHALGETTADVAALIEAYAEKDPVARASLTQWRQVSTVAAKSLTLKPVVLPPFPREALQRATAQRRWQPWLLGGLGIAASVLVGFFFGVRSNIQAPDAPAEVSFHRATPTVSPAPANVAAVPDFWSMARVRAVALRAKEAPETPALVTILQSPLHAQPFGVRP